MDFPNFIDPTGLIPPGWAGANISPGTFRTPWDLYNSAIADAKARYPNSPPNGIGDAYRHCLASCWATSIYGSSLAAAAGWANEVVGENPTDQREMDENNNRCGRELGGGPGANPSDCPGKCANAAGSGALQTL